MKSRRPGVNRRDLLGLRRHGVPAASPAEGVNDHRRGSDLVRAHRPAMGSYFEVRLPAGTPGAVELACRALDLIDALETQLTVYRDDSEVSRVNAMAHLGPVEVERGLFGLLELAVAVSHETGGAYDVTAGALSEAWGFVKGPKRVPDEQALADARARTGCASPAARSEQPHHRIRPRGRSDQPGEHRQGLRDRPGGRCDSRALVADFGPGARRPLEPLRPRLTAGPGWRAAGRSRCGTRSSRSGRWARFGCEIEGSELPARRSSSLSSTGEFMAT